MTKLAARSPLYLLVLALLAIALLLFSALLLDRETQSYLSREHGEIEMGTVVGYFACIVLMLARGGNGFVVRHWFLPLILLLMTLKELDFDKRFTTMGILKISFYLSAEVPVVEKLIALFIIALAMYAVVTLVKKHFSEFIVKLRSLRPEALAIGVAIAFVVISTGLDGLDRKLAGIGITTGESISTIAELIEEILEFGIPLMLLIGIWTYLRRDRLPS